MKSPLGLGRASVEEHCLGQDRQTFQKRAVNKRQGMLQVAESRVRGDGLELLAEFGDDFFQPFWLEDVGGFA